MNEDKINRIKAVVYSIRDLRRYYNKQLDDVVAEEKKEYNSEDLMRLVGTLEAAYNHALASIADDGDTYCLLKHLSYAVILAGEMESPMVDDIYDVISIISNGIIEPCQSCKREESEEE